MASAVAVDAAPSLNLICKSNAKAERAFAFINDTWETADRPVANTPFRSGHRADNVAELRFRDNVFSGLDTESPKVGAIIPSRDGGESKRANFSATVVSRTKDSVSLLWRDGFDNKMWLGIVDLTRRKAAVSQVYQGATSLGVGVETFDCE